MNCVINQTLQNTIYDPIICGIWSAYYCLHTDVCNYPYMQKPQNHSYQRLILIENEVVKKLMHNLISKKQFSHIK
ncbi:MAG: hypothetical protein IJ848_00050 [Alphaproteobacteria bacterium]|nr:hypothetical protein [Alphaproteobacteria bacterium]